MVMSYRKELNAPYLFAGQLAASVLDVAVETKAKAKAWFDIISQLLLFISAFTEERS